MADAGRLDSVPGRPPPETGRPCRRPRPVLSRAVCAPPHHAGGHPHACRSWPGPDLVQSRIARPAGAGRPRRRASPGAAPSDPDNRVERRAVRALPDIERTAAAAPVLVACAARTWATVRRPGGLDFGQAVASWLETRKRRQPAACGRPRKLRPGRERADRHPPARTGAPETCDRGRVPGHGGAARRGTAAERLRRGPATVPHHRRRGPD